MAQISSFIVKSGLRTSVQKRSNPSFFFGPTSATTTQYGVWRGKSTSTSTSLSVVPSQSVILREPLVLGLNIQFMNPIFPDVVNGKNTRLPLLSHTVSLFAH